MNEKISRLRQARIDAGLKQVELALRARVGIATVSRLELYPFRPTTATAEKLSRALGVTKDKLFPSLAGK